jgi:SAM-dependent methyltransferase
VNSALWSYAHSERLAADEADYFRDHPLLRADVAALDEQFREPGALIDLGSGAGRLSVHFAQRGFAVLAVDLSRPMLRQVGARADHAGLAVGRLQANLCRLDCVRDQSFRYAISMFSTLGMIRGVSARRAALAHAYRVLVPGGSFALHAHNFWLNLRGRQARRWLLGQAWKAARRDLSLGDRQMTYRGIPGVEVHLYRFGELARELRLAGFHLEHVLPISELSAEPISAPWWLPTIRAGGWLVFARRPGRA